MNKTLSFIKLDFITIKPYMTWRNLLIFAAVGLIIIISSGSDAPAATIGLLMAFAAIYVSYPFAVGEKNGIDALYVTLAIKRNSVVMGRYPFALVIDISAALIAYVFPINGLGWGGSVGRYNLRFIPGFTRVL